LHLGGQGTYSTLYNSIISTLTSVDVKGPFLAWMTYGLRGNNAIGIGIVNSIANISGWIGPSVQAAAYHKQQRKEKKEEENENYFS
jgi:hypothetical protein